MKPDQVYTVLATTAQILTNENTVYKACPNKYRCKKKMSEDNGLFYCASCNVSCNNFVYRYILNVKFAGIGGVFMGHLFDELAGELFGMGAEFYNELGYQERASVVEMALF